MLVVTGRSQNYVVFHTSKCPSQEKTQSKNVPVKKSPSQKMSMESRKGLSRNVDQEMSVKKRPIKKRLDTPMTIPTPPTSLRIEVPALCNDNNLWIHQISCFEMWGTNQKPSFCWNISSVIRHSTFQGNNIYPSH